MKSEDLDRRITIQQRVSVETSKGENAYTWTTFATVWANVRPLRGREFHQAAQYQSEITIKFTVRYNAAIVETMRVLYLGKPFDIAAPPIDVGGMHLWTELMAKAGTGDGRDD